METDKVRKQLTTLYNKFEFIESNIEDIKDRIDKFDDQLYFTEEARQIIQRAAQLTQEQLEIRLSEIVSQALGLVFDDLSLGFSVKFVQKRNSTECEMYITEGGEEYDPLNSCGFGAADVASFALRIAMWAINPTSPIMVFDEPFRNLDEWRMPHASELLSTLSEELGIQMIVVTHEDSLAQSANKVFRVVKKKGISRVLVEKEIENH